MFLVLNFVNILAYLKQTFSNYKKRNLAVDGCRIPPYFSWAVFYTTELPKRLILKFNVRSWEWGGGRDNACQIIKGQALLE